jgi:glycine oxidase
MKRSRPKVVVIGGGVIGGATAWRLARRGAAVVLLERGQPGEQASSAAAGMLSPLKEAEEPGPFLDIGLRSLERYPDFVDAIQGVSGLDVGYRRDGRLDVALDEAAADALRTHQRLQAEAGFDSRLLEPAEIRRLEQEITPDAVLALATEHDHQIDNRQLMRALWIAMDREGVEVRTGTGASAVVVDNERVTGVRLVDGSRVDADQVVVAAGAWSGQLELPRPLPIRPVRGQVVVVRTVPPVLGRTTWGPMCYLVPRRDGRLLVGSTMEEVGFRPHVTAGAVQRLLGIALRIVPALADAVVEGFQVGLRPASADGLPIIGPDPEVDGLFYATGHFRNGLLLAPETAERVTAMLMDGELPEPAFDPARFDPAGSDPVDSDPADSDPVDSDHEPSS